MRAVFSIQVPFALLMVKEAQYNITAILADDYTITFLLPTRLDNDLGSSEDSATFEIDGRPAQQMNIL